MRYESSSMFARSLVAGCMMVGCMSVGCDEKTGASESAEPPTCEQVVARSDQLAIEWAARESEEKAAALERVIDGERAGEGVDPAVTFCEERLTDTQRRCVMAAKDLLAKNECLKQ